MHRPRPNKRHDELDALLDGRPVELTDELAPLAEAADSLRAELATYQLDPGVRPHLEGASRARHGGPAASGGPAGDWEVRRRVVGVAWPPPVWPGPPCRPRLPGQAYVPVQAGHRAAPHATVQWPRPAGVREGLRTRASGDPALVDLRCQQVGPAVTAWPRRSAPPGAVATPRRTARRARGGEMNASWERPNRKRDVLWELSIRAQSCRRAQPGRDRGGGPGRPGRAPATADPACRRDPDSDHGQPGHLLAERPADPADPAPEHGTVVAAEHHAADQRTELRPDNDRAAVDRTADDQ